MKNLKNSLYTALVGEFEAQKNKALYNMNLAFQNPVAVGEHPKIVDDCIILVNQIAEADEAIEALNNYFGDMND